MRIKRILSFSLLLFSLNFNAQQLNGIYKIDDLLSRLKNPDTLYVVNFWAVWCKPCILELPSFDSLTTEYKNEPVKVLLVSLDFKEDAEKKVNAFIKKKNLKAECVLLDEVNGNDYIDRISTSWSGSIPATYFKKGTRTALVEKKLTLKLLREQLLLLEI